MAELTSMREESTREEFTPKIDQAIQNHAGECLRKQCQQNGTAGTLCCREKVRQFMHEIIGLPRLEKTPSKHHREYVTYARIRCACEELKNN